MENGGLNATISNVRPRAKFRTYLLFYCILVPTGLGFSYKLIELFRVFLLSADGAFAIMPIANYLLATMGFALLLFWAAANGTFREIENPKNDLFLQEQLLDTGHNLCGEFERPLPGEQGASK